MSGEGLSVQEAIDATEREISAPASEAVETKPEEVIEADPTAETPEEADEAEPEGETAESGEPEEAQEAEPAAAIEPPRFWDADKKEMFRALTPELQAYVVAKESERDKATSIAMQRASERTKAVEAEASKLSALSTNLDKLIPDAQQKFKSRWDNVDWNAVVDQYGAEAALKLRNDYESESATIQQLSAAKAEVDTIQTSKFVSERFEAMKTVAPELTDDKEGASRQLELVKYLSGFGVNPDVIIKRASAHELAIGYKAMLYDKAQSKAKTAATAPKQAAQAPRMTVRPTASVAPGSQQSAKLKSAQAAFNRDPSTANLTALLQAEGT